ncbi:Mut7-C RNAse domain-containing protein [bacterium]|nr:Mut7-C RNAse domain-containing protein [bacterium]MBU4561345.1 Mut7-C RNAse domain-containing protein [bacterium]MCG2676892.1 Mut7-C RNAse domain-containing protein [bacterium]
MTKKKSKPHSAKASWGKELKFVCDRMLGTLARFLRILGYDTLYPEESRDAELLFLAYTQGRVLLTRDTKMGTRISPNIFVIKSAVPEEQLKKVVKEFKLKTGENLFTRCLECNTPLVEVEKKEVKGRVPPYVFKHHDEFAKCPKCKKYYWSGTHIERMEERIKKWEEWMR